MLLYASFGEATGLNTSGLLEVPYQSSRQSCSIYFSRTYCECSRRTVHEAFDPDHRERQSNRCSIRHAHALGCLLIFSVAFAICTARSSSRVLWQTRRVIPGIYRRRPVYLPVKPRYTCANGQTVVQAANSIRTFGLTYMCGHETCFVSLLELPFCASCMFCLRKALGMLLVDHCGLQPVDNRLQTWSCRGHSALLQHMRSARMFLVRTALDLNSARDVPQPLSHGCTVTVTYVILRRSARINGSGHKATSSHGNNKQPRLNMVLDLKPGPQFRKQGSVLKCPRVCSGIITQCPVQTGPSAFGRVIASLRKVALPSCLRAISDPEFDMCRSGASQRHVCQGRLRSDQPASQEYQSQRDGLISAPPGPQHTEDAYARVATIGRVSQVVSKQNEAMVKEHGLRRVSGKAKCNTIMMRRSHSGRPLRKVSQQSVASTVYSVLCKAAFVCLLLGSCYITSHTMICMKCRPSQVCDAWGVGSCPSTVNLIVQLNLSCRGRFTSEAMCSAQEQPIAGNASQLGSHLDVCCTAYHIWISAMIVASVSYISKHIGALCNQLVLRPFKSAHLTSTNPTQTSPTIHVSGLPGPKSGGGIPCRSARTIILSAYFCIKGATGVKVAPPAVGGAEGGQAQQCRPVAPPKPYGHLSPQTVLLQDQVRKATKRSFKRACRRALQYGQAKYKGSTITMKMIQPSWLDCAKVTSKPHRSTRERKGLRVFCWNSGGLASGQWDELLLHIDPQAWDILLIQETHWAESRDFVTGPWSCIASSAGRGSKAGVLIMVHQRLCHNSMLRAEHVLPGRLLRIRLPLPGKDLRHLQVICAYQKAWNSRQASSVIEQRSSFWNKLDAALASVPSRDALIPGGDLNVSIPMTTGTAGAGVSPPPQDGATDASDLIGIAKQHGLIFLNTWHGRGTPVHTFQFGKYRAQLDFLLCKTLHADGVARQSRPWHKFQLSQGSESGAVHYPVHANIPVKKTNWHCQGPKSNSAIDKEAIIQAACNLSESEADSVTQLRQMVRHEMQKLEHPTQLAQVPHIVSRACAQLFPAKCADTTKQAIWQDAGVVASVRETWRLWRSMRAVEGRTLVSMFRKWSFLARHLKARKLQRKLSKQTRRQKLLAYVDQAAEAASKHDVRRLYEVVNKLSRPRQKRVALRGPHNELLSAEEEADLLASHFSILFKAVYEEDVALQKLPWSTEGNIQLDEYALSCACAAAPLRKAVPPGHPPSAVWRLIAQETAITVSRVVNQAWLRGTASVPRGWSDAFLVLLPKPDKNGADPKHLRPVGLQDQVGKLTLQSLLMPHKELIYQHTNKYPQYAYTPGRSYRGALYRVFQHCDLVRSLCRKHRRNLQARYAGGDVTKLVGGLQVSVDLTQAFDQMPRWLLLKGMRAMGLEEDFVSVLMRWITQSEYEISHMGHVRRFDASRGVRQGCVASPILWIIFVHSICDELAGKVGYSRVCQILTLFADDFHGQWTFYSLAELEEALDVLALLFSTLHKFGMTVNASKSKAIIAVAGTQAPQIKKKFVRVIENCPHLKVNDKGLLIPLVDSCVLGGQGQLQRV